MFENIDKHIIEVTPFIRFQIHPSLITMDASYVHLSQPDWSTSYLKYMIYLRYINLLPENIRIGLKMI